VILMHMQGEPGTMQADPTYEDAAKEVLDYLTARVQACEAAGINRDRLALDPGIGFGKTVAHNVQILKHLKFYERLGLPVLLGASRKSFIGKIAHEDDSRKLLSGSLARGALRRSARGEHSAGSRCA